MDMTIDYLVADPSGNTTILVLTPVPKEEHSALAAKLLALPGIEAEQVGYVTREAGKPLRVDMMGGEFCGNASRSAAAWALACDGGTQGVYDVSCSGCDTVLPAKVAQKGDGLYEAFIEMPYPEDVSGVLVDAGDVPARFFRVDLPGITHFVHFVPDLEGIDKEKYWHILADYVDGEDFPAYGLILCDTKEQTMIPAVYVRDTDTLYWENSCGSGSAAVAAALACTTHKNVACYMKQPGGTLAIAAKVGEQGELQQIFIGGPVKLSQVQKATI
jgi:diaminopimelate epimerase